MTLGILERAFQSVIKQKKRYILLFLLSLIFINVIIGGLAINKATRGIGIIIKKSIPTVAIIRTDVNAYISDYYTSDDINIIGKLATVKKYNYNSYLAFETANLQAVDTSGEIAHFNIQGVHDWTFLTDTTIEKLISGRIFVESDFHSTNNPIIIPERLAELNNLTVGDIIELDFVIRELGQNDYQQIFSTDIVLSKQAHSFEVIGIFAPKISNQPNTDINNQIYTLNSCIQPLFTQQNLFYQDYYTDDFKMQTELKRTVEAQYDAEFVLDNWDDKLAFISEAGKLLPTGYRILLQPTIIDNIINGIQSMNSLATLTLIISIGSSIIVLIGVLLIFMRNRKREFGILLAIGEKNTKIILQLIIELLLVVWSALAVSLITGNIVATKLTDVVLTQEIIANETAIQLSLTDEEVMRYCTLQIYEYVLIIIVGSTVTVIIAVIGPAISILRLSPRKIML
jgi:ABC-type transport system, involved in lipoprotein release, permease component